MPRRSGEAAKAGLSCLRTSFGSANHSSLRRSVRHDAPARAARILQSIAGTQIAETDSGVARIHCLCAVRRSSGGGTAVAFAVAGRKAPRLRSQECQSQTPLLRWPHPRRPRPSRPPQRRPLPSHRPIPALGSFTSLSNSPTSGAHSTSNAIGNQAPVARLPGDTSVERHQPVAVQGRWQIHGPDSAEAFGPKYGELVPYLGAAVTTALTPRPAELTLAPADLPISRGSGSSRGSE
jgi:hypothetical protein